MIQELPTGVNTPWRPGGFRRLVEYMKNQLFKPLLSPKVLTVDDCRTDLGALEPGAQPKDSRCAAGAQVRPVGAAGSQIRSRL